MMCTPVGGACRRGVQLARQGGAQAVSRSLKFSALETRSRNLKRPEQAAGAAATNFDTTPTAPGCVAAQQGPSGQHECSPSTLEPSSLAHSLCSPGEILSSIVVMVRLDGQSELTPLDLSVPLSAASKAHRVWHHTASAVGSNRRRCTTGHPQRVAGAGPGAADSLSGPMGRRPLPVAGPRASAGGPLSSFQFFSGGGPGCIGFATFSSRAGGACADEHVPNGTAQAVAGSPDSDLDIQSLYGSVALGVTTGAPTDGLNRAPFGSFADPVPRGREEDRRPPPVAGMSSSGKSSSGDVRGSDSGRAGRSSSSGSAPVTIRTLRRKKAQKKPITMVTAYDACIANIVNDYVDCVLIGDSLGMTFAGHSTTVPVTMDEMVYHCRAVSRGAPRPYLIGDMVFGSYLTVDDALRNSVRLVKEGNVAAVKLEGGLPQVPKVQAMTNEGVGVIGHIGLTPQSVHSIGGYRTFGASKEEADQLLEDALALEDAGAKMLVLEMVPADLAQAITDVLSIPTIGIGAGPHTSGQVLVSNDLFGLYPSPPRFAKQYADGRRILTDAVATFCSEVENREFPAEEHYRAAQKQHRDASPSRNPHTGSAEHVPCQPTQQVNAASTKELLVPNKEALAPARPVCQLPSLQDLAKPTPGIAQPSRVAVLGGGAVGMRVAAALEASKACKSVVLVTTRPAGSIDRQDSSLAENAGEMMDIVIQDTNWQNKTTQPVSVVHPCRLEESPYPGNIDVAVVCVKSSGTEAAGRVAKQLLGLPSSCLAAGRKSGQGMTPPVVLTLQNGGGNLEILQTILGDAANVLYGCTYQAALRTPDGIRITGKGDTLLVPSASSAVAFEQAAALASLFSDAGLPTDGRPFTELATVLWNKLLINCTLNPVTALLGIRNGGLLALPREQRALLAKLADECVMVGQAEGANMPELPLEKIMEVASCTAANKSSMLVDVEAGRRTELAALNGYVVASAQPHNINTPAHSRVVQQIDSLDAFRRFNVDLPSHALFRHSASEWV